VLQQFDTPQMIKERPANLFTGTFVGEPPMNVFEAFVGSGAGRINLRLPDGLSLDYDKDAFSGPVREALLNRERVIIGIRPYAVRRSKDGVPATVSANQWLGDQTHIAADFAGGSLVLVEHDRTRLELGAPINVSIDPANLHVFDQSSGNAISHGMELA
ncbi:ABC transporter ATP-binding protein, partial [Mesorhizobium sp. M00.F.Ca.ET.149.01.1.1]